ncbi:MAG: hypothetical protein LJE59_09870 [Chromatiaceae bacterium]|jgi:hypothetical protein|nr:hypothetical protein [Chromatiaceae bacterium]
MKKRLLALGVATALGMSAGVASAMQTEPSGIGMYNILPYYSVQSGNNTLIQITNTDEVNGKAVKVRFRGAEWSDDVFDFTLFLSPGDVWTGAVTVNGLVAHMDTVDNSCTLPANINQDFVTFRAALSEDSNAATREGYVEVITMADIPPTVGGDPEEDLYDTILHHNGEAACDSGVLTALTEDSANVAADQGMENPTPALTSYAIVINVPKSKAFAQAAIAVNPDSVNNKIYYMQKNVEINPADLAELQALTADRIFAAQGAPDNGVGLQMYQFDLPDLTTPVEGGTAIAQRDSLTDALAQNGDAVVEYVTDSAIDATTDVVFTQPTRRFFYNYIENADGAYELNGWTFDIEGDAGSVYDSLDGVSNRIAVGNPTFYDREEGKLVGEDDIVISPTPPNVALTFSLKGEASVISINNGAIPTGSLAASLTANNYETNLEAPDGWAILSTTTTSGTVGPLPIVGFTAINILNNAVGAAGTNYGMVLPLRQREYVAP